MEYQDNPELFSVNFALPGEPVIAGQPVLIKCEKTILQGDKELEVDCEFNGMPLIQSNRNLQESLVRVPSPLPWLTEENPDDPRSSLGNIPELSNLDLRCLFSNPGALLETNIQVMPSKKLKNPPYLVKGNDITTKNMTPVSFKLTGLSVGDTIHVSLRYSDEFYKKNPVNPCKLHEEFCGRPHVLPKGFGFYILPDAHQYLEESHHPTGIIRITDPNMDSLEFLAIFLCLNSCHRDNGKHTHFLISIRDADKIVKEEEKFTIRVCKNVKRDHREKSGELAPRKRPSTDDKDQEPLKVRKRRLVVPKKEEETLRYVFQMPTKKKEDTILALIELLGGTFSDAPV